MNGFNRMWTFCFRFVLATLVAAAVGLAVASHASFLATLPHEGSEIGPQKPQDDRPDKPKPQSSKYESIVLRGTVLELGPHLLQAFSVAMDDDLGKAVVALVTDSGEVHPLVKDVRSRGFWMDKRLRDRPMELHVHKFPGLPFVRLIDTYSFKDGKKYAVDYWCTVCAITTFEPGPCPCCQDEIELRERPVGEIKSR
jgi:hypothetical protein